MVSGAVAFMCEIAIRHAIHTLANVGLAALICSLALALSAISESIGMKRRSEW